jgi:hypothetical protein
MDLKRKIHESPVFSVVIDESTDISETEHMIVYAQYLEKGEVSFCVDYCHAVYTCCKDLNS